MNDTGASDRDPQALLRLCHLVSPALPVGAYAYSQGLEYAVHAGWVHDEASTLDWLQGLSANAIGTLDLPILLRLYRAWSVSDLPGVRHWSAQLLAARETSELRAEELHLGRALARVLVELDIGEAGEWQQAAPAFATLFSPGRCSLAHRRGRRVTRLSVGLEREPGAGRAQAGAAGQSSGQRLLHRLTAAMPGIVERAQTLATRRSASVPCRRRSPARCMSRNTRACFGPDRQLPGGRGHTRQAGAQSATFGRGFWRDD